MPEAAILGALKRKCAGLIGGEFHGSGNTFFELLLNVVRRQLEPMIAVDGRNHELNALALFNGDHRGIEFVFLGCHLDGVAAGCCRRAFLCRECKSEGTERKYESGYCDHSSMLSHVAPHKEVIRHPHRRLAANVLTHPEYEAEAERRKPVDFEIAEASGAGEFDDLAARVGLPRAGHPVQPRHLYTP